MWLLSLLGFGMALAAFLWLGRSARKQATPTRVYTVDVSSFPDALHSYGGAVDCAPDGALLGWCGNRIVASGSSVLPLLRLPDETLRAFHCQGTGPDGYLFPSVVIDPRKQTFYAFGGWGAAAQGPTNELWRISLADPGPRWERVAVNGRAPAARNGAPMILDAARSRLILCGGDGGTGNAFAPLADCWQFDLTRSTWTQLPPDGQPPERWHAAMAVDPKGGKAYLFGGAGAGAAQFDDTLYELNLTTDRWQALPTSGSAPPSLQGATMTFDLANRVLVLAGGLLHQGPGPATLSKVWVFDPASGQWDETDCGEPLRRRDHVGAYDSVTGEHVLLGGRVSATVGNFFDRGSLVSQDVRLKVRKLATPAVVQSGAMSP